jgi:hypothetical protein
MTNVIDGVKFRKMGIISHPFKLRRVLELRSLERAWWRKANKLSRRGSV